ncbi:MAG: hypothetical protein WC549_00580 [Actinomycetota bacterium]
MPSVTYTFNPNTTAESSQVNQNFSDLSAAIRPTFVFTLTGTLATGVNLTPALVVPLSLTIVKAYIYAKTAPTGQAAIIDINVNGTSIWSATQANRLQLADGSQTGSQTSFDTTALADGDVITIDCDVVGSTIAGSDVTIQLKCS